MRKIELKTRKLLRAIFGTISLTAVAFVFQACYGMERDYCFDTRLSGTVLSKTTNLPIKGIKIKITGSVNYGITDETGNFDFYASICHYEISPNNLPITFMDIDGEENGSFENREMTIDVRGQDEVKINVTLEEKIEIE